MKTHEIQGNMTPTGEQRKVAQQKRQLCQFYRQTRKKQYSRLQSAVHQWLERTDRLHHLVRKEQQDGEEALSASLARSPRGDQGTGRASL
jgi:gas vesicle protein